MVASKPRRGKSSSFSGSMGWQATFLIVAFMFSFGLSAQMKQVPSPKITATATAQMKVLQGIKVAKTPQQNKIESRLYLGLQNLRDPQLRGQLPDFRFVRNGTDGRVPVDIILVEGAGVKPVLKKLESLGEIILAKSQAFRRVSARVRLENLEALAAMPEIRRVRQAIPAKTNAINTSEGDATHGADEARAFFGNIGTGVKIGVLSDGVDSRFALQASGDLPAVEVLPGQEGSGDEGSAMLEIIHDLAPGAELAFATALPDEATFAQNILDLAAAGCNIIVDDIIYLAESPFQDGPVAQAVNTVTTAGVLYFSSAGNEGNVTDLTSGVWEGDFLASAAADPAPLAGAALHDFGDGGNSILVEFGGGNPPLLIWAEHYDLSTGLASTDFDIYDMDGALTTIFDASTDVQDGVGGDDFPIEFIEGGTFGGERLLIDRFAAGSTSSVPIFNLIVFRGELDDNLVTPGATRGHSSAAEAYSVAATPAADSFDGITPDGPFPGLFTSANESESFTSDGPRRIVLSPTGVEITPGNRTSTGGIVRQKPDITAADGVATAAPGFDPFYGTSAAAPHAAAIAALIKSSVPLVTPAQVRTALVSTAIDIETPGTDRDTGAGIVMAHASMAAAGAIPGPLLSAGTAVPTQVAGDGDAFVENNEIWNLTIPLTNDGPVTATAINAVLSTSTPGVTIAPNASAYPNLATGASANNLTPYTFSLLGAECGVFIEFTLTVTYAGGGPSPQAFDFTIQTGSPGTPVVITYVGPVVPIPDGGDLFGTLPGAPAIASLLVSGVTGLIYDVNLRIDGSVCSAADGSTTVGIDHTFVNDLEIRLASPATTSALVINNTDSNGNNFCQTVLDDDGGGASIQSVLAAANPFTGTFTPNAPLTIFDGENANGTWELQAQDFFSDDTGNIRVYSLIITPAVCDAPVLGANVNGTKTVAGTFNAGGTVTYTVTLTNSGATAQLDNAGNEFIDVLPASLTLVSAVASSGTPTANVNPNEVTWNGTIAPSGGSVTITITATINSNVAAGTVVSNQGTINYDGDGNNSNEATRPTDDPGVGGATDPTNFTVVGAVVTGTKTASAGPYNVGDNVTYTITLSNSGNGPAGDNPGNEFTDVLPAGLTLVSASASSGSAVASVGTNTVTWNGSIPASSNVTITIVATINPSAGGTTVTNQGSFSFDANQDGVNESSGNTDDPGTGAAGDGTAIAVEGAALDTVTKTVSGTFAPGSPVTYTIIISNIGDALQGDNAGNELTDILPPALTLVSATATSGTPVANVGTNTVTWNGSIPAGGSVTITINAILEPGNEGLSICNQATHLFDGNDDGVNETTVLSNDPGTPAANDATCFVAAAAAVAIPTASELGLLLLAVGLAMLAAWKISNS